MPHAVPKRRGVHRLRVGFFGGWVCNVAWGAIRIERSRSTSGIGVAECGRGTPAREQRDLHMAYRISREAITSKEELVKRDLLTYVDYGGGGRRICSWPQFALRGDEAIVVEKAALPDMGGLPIAVSSGDKRSLEGEFGQVVVMRVNDPDFSDNHFYSEEGHAYNAVIDPNRRPGDSMIEFKNFSSHPASARLVQVLNLDDGKKDFSKPIVRGVVPYGDQAEPLTKLVMIAQAGEGRKLYYGPFEAEERPGYPGSYRLAATQQFNYFVNGVDESDFDFLLEITDGGGGIFASFVDIDELDTRCREPFVRYDWMPDSELLDAFGRFAKSTMPSISRTEMRDLKSALSAAASIDAMVDGSEERRNRMARLVESRQNWDEMTDEGKADAVAAIETAKLADFVMSDENFAEFFERVKDDPRVRKEIDVAQAELKRQIKTFEDEAERQRGLAEKAEREREDAEARRDEVKDEIVGAARARLEAIESEVGEKRDEAARLEARIAELKKGESEASLAVGNVVRGLKDQVDIAEKVMESALLQEAIGSLCGFREERDEGGAAPSPAAQVVVAPELELPARPVVEDGVDAGVILGRMRGVLASQGREMSANDAANLAICLTQGGITTLAGLPGTGKTTLAGILAGALGLRQPGAERFSEISVERGWTSYKDMIGYRNGFTGAVEPGNLAAWRGLAALDAEAAESPDEGVPWLMLLDEANLSPIEHYWSPFLMACGRKGGRAVELSLGGGDSLAAPDWLRFVATVNFDHTTEELSPRFLDRSWVVMLAPLDIALEADELDAGAVDFSGMPAYTMETLRRAFGSRRAQIPAAGAQRLQEALATCARHKRPVSPRSQIMMRDYLSAAYCVMNVDSAATANDPVDYALSQKVLPMVSGDAAVVEPLLRELSEIGGLPRVKAHAERMLEAGGDLGYIQFFS